MSPLKRLADTHGQEKATRQTLVVLTNTKSTLASPFNPPNILTLFIFLPKSLSLGVQNWRLEKANNWQTGRVHNWVLAMNILLGIYWFTGPVSTKCANSLRVPRI